MNNQTVATTSNFTSIEEARIQEQIKAHQEKIKQDQIETEIRNRVLDAQRQQPGYQYY